MASSYLTPRAPELKGSDTVSEIGSESGTTTSGWTSGWDSREDLRDFATKIGLKDVAELYQERFRVNRKKLEQMLSGDNEAPLPADIFFEQIMSDTGTFITWPTKLKIGAKSKKDPHVRIAGIKDDVHSAKDRIMTILDIRCNRVTMKMDVSYTDHSHIIGKGGLSIKRVMEETQCHVHFPDSNRSNPSEKSNQVSIAGDIQGIERARSRVRQKTPVVFGFELPIMSKTIDPSSYYIVKIEEEYNVQVMLRTRPKLHATLVTVKGVEWEVDEVKKATLLLVKHMCDNLANQIPIQMTMEISPHHHQMVIGKNHSNLKEIMRVTGAQIMFPDAQDPNIPNLKKSNVTITGNINSVYAARQLLIGSLPLLLMFDLPQATTGLAIRPENISEIQTKYDVTISIRLKAKQNTKACVIKGTEKWASNIYKARNEILCTDDPQVIVDIPASYHMPKTSQNVHQPIEVTIPSLNTQPPLSPMLSPLISPSWQYPPNPFTQSNSFMNMIQQHQQFFFNPLHHSLSSSGYHSMGQFSGSSLSLEQGNRDASNYSTALSSTSTSSPVSSPRNVSPSYQHRNCADSEISSILSDVSSSGGCGGFHGLSGAMEKNDESPVSPTLSEYEQKRLSGFKAMQSRPSGVGYRYPNNAWSGYGISHTAPGITISKNDYDVNAMDDIWKTPTPQHNADSWQMDANSSNILDHTPGNMINRLTSTKWPDLTTLFASIGLEKYLGLFLSHEIDLMAFSSMTEKDLAELGVNAFGPRRKMLLAIAELKKRGNQFLPAPGAERKTSTASNSCTPRDKW
ncbi:putative RNA binding protein [Trypoxylus dichotomus]